MLFLNVIWRKLIPNLKYYLPKINNNALLLLELFHDLRLYGELNFRHAVGDPGAPSYRVSNWPWSEEADFCVGLLSWPAVDELDSVSLPGSMEDQQLEAVLVRWVDSAAPAAGGAAGMGNHVEVKLRLPLADFSKRELLLSWEAELEGRNPQQWECLWLASCCNLDQSMGENIYLSIYELTACLSMNTFAKRKRKAPSINTC